MEAIRRQMDRVFKHPTLVKLRAIDARNRDPKQYAVACLFTPALSLLLMLLQTYRKWEVVKTIGIYPGDFTWSFFLGIPLHMFGNGTWADWRINMLAWFLLVPECLTHMGPLPFGICHVILSLIAGVFVFFGASWEHGSDIVKQTTIGPRGFLSGMGGFLIYAALWCLYYRLHTRAGRAAGLVLLAYLTYYRIPICDGPICRASIKYIVTSSFVAGFILAFIWCLYEGKPQEIKRREEKKPALPVTVVPEIREPLIVHHEPPPPPPKPKRPAETLYYGSFVPPTISSKLAETIAQNEQKKEERKQQLLAQKQTPSGNNSAQNSRHSIAVPQQTQAQAAASSAPAAGGQRKTIAGAGPGKK